MRQWQQARAFSKRIPSPFQGEGEGGGTTHARYGDLAFTPIPAFPVARGRCTTLAALGGSWGARAFEALTAQAPALPRLLTR